MVQIQTIFFKKNSITDLPFEELSIYFVFTHKISNYLNDEDLEKGVTKIYLVARKHSINCEMYTHQNQKPQKFLHLEICLIDEKILYFIQSEMGKNPYFLKMALTKHV